MTTNLIATNVFWWWLLLCAVSAINLLAWWRSAAVLARRSATLSADAYDSRRVQLLLSAGFVLGCAFRSALPVYDVPRLCLFDTWFSSALVGRSVATFAELCFAAQWALLLHEYAHAAGSRMGKAAAAAIVPLLVIAETFSWRSVLTTSNLGHVIEESLWGVCGVLLAASLAAILPRCDRTQRPLLGTWCVASAGYAAYMFLVDVPMYWTRWVADEANGRVYLSLADGLRDASQRWVVSHQWADWQSEVVWMALYFSVGVWVSLSLIHAPLPKQSASARRGVLPAWVSLRAVSAIKRNPQ